MHAHEKDLKKLFSSNLFHIKWNRKIFGFRTTEQLSKDFPLTLILKPQIPKADPKREDVITSRICFSTTLDGAIGSLGLNNAERNFYIGIYKPTKSIEIIYPFSSITHDRKFFVHDACKWNEVWSLYPVEAELLKIINPYEKIGD